MHKPHRVTLSIHLHDVERQSLDHIGHGCKFDENRLRLYIKTKQHKFIYVLTLDTLNVIHERRK